MIEQSIGSQLLVIILVYLYLGYIIYKLDEYPDRVGVYLIILWPVRLYSDKSWDKLARFILRIKHEKEVIIEKVGIHALNIIRSVRRTPELWVFYIKRNNKIYKNSPYKVIFRKDGDLRSYIKGKRIWLNNREKRLINGAFSNALIESETLHYNPSEHLHDKPHNIRENEDI